MFRIFWATATPRQQRIESAKHAKGRQSDHGLRDYGLRDYERAGSHTLTREFSVICYRLKGRAIKPMLLLREAKSAPGGAVLPPREVESIRRSPGKVPYRPPSRHRRAHHQTSILGNAQCSIGPLRPTLQPLHIGQMFSSPLDPFNCPLQVPLLVVFRIVSRSTGQRDFYAARVQEVSMRSFATAINKPMLLQISNELPNRTNNIIGEENCNETVSI